MGSANGTTTCVSAFPFISSSVLCPTRSVFSPWAFCLAALPVPHRYGNTVKLSVLEGPFSRHSPVWDPLSCVQREIVVILIITVSFSSQPASCMNIAAVKYCWCALLPEEVLLGWQWVLNQEAGVLQKPHQHRHWRRKQWPI